MINELNKIAKEITGSVLVIGFFEEDKIIQILEKNKKLSLFSHLTSKSKERNQKIKRKRKFFGNKTINIKKLYKELKKERYDYIICEFDIVKPYLDNFIRNSYKITNKKIYFILSEDMYDYEELELRYNRYKATTLTQGAEGEYLVEVDVTKMHMNIFKRIIYRLRDTIYNISEFISNIIIS